MFPNLKAEMARNGQKNCDVAEKLGISRQGFAAKMRTGSFKLSEAKALCELYHTDFNYLFAEENQKGA